MKIKPWINNILITSTIGVFSFLVLYILKETLSLNNEDIIIYPTGIAVFFWIKGIIKSGKYKKIEFNLNSDILYKTEASMTEPTKLNNGYFYILDNQLFFLVVWIGGRSEWKVNKEKIININQVNDKEINITIPGEKFTFRICETEQTIKILKELGWIVNKELK